MENLTWLYFTMIYDDANFANSPESQDWSKNFFNFLKENLIAFLKLFPLWFD